MKTALIIFFLLISLMMPVFQATAQELNLFQDIELPSAPAAERTRAPRRNPTNNQNNTEPAFTLSGTVKFGDNFQSSLLSRNGKKVTVKWTDGNVSMIDGFNAYSVVHVGSRTVSLRLPQGEDCIEAIEKGVSCDSSGRITILSLSHVEPLISNVQTSASVAALTPSTAVETNSNQENRFQRRNRRLQRAVTLPPEMLDVMEDNIPRGMRIESSSEGMILVPDFD